MRGAQAEPVINELIMRQEEGRDRPGFGLRQEQPGFRLPTDRPGFRLRQEQPGFRPHDRLG
jgi:hypothetical protein